MNKKNTRTNRVFFSLFAFSVFALQVNLANAHIDLVPVEGLSGISNSSPSLTANPNEINEIPGLNIFDAGNDCATATTIASLPYNTNGNTADFGNDYSNADVPEEAVGAVTNGTGSEFYLSGPEAVYAYTPASNLNITADLSGFTGWTALWVFTGCPFSSTVGYHTSTSGTERSIPELPLTAGVTYYFVVATWESQTASTTFNLTITENVSCPPGSDTEGLLIGSSCDDGDPTTLFDTVSEECTCVGQPSSPGQLCENPLPITSLPFLTNDNTSNYLDVYSGAPGTFTNCGTSSSYLNGEDVVYSFTPAQPMTVTITMTPSATSTGVFVYGACADIGTDCIAGDASFTNGPKVIEELPLNGGETIYIVISGSTVSNMDYTLEIVELVTCPPGSETEGLIIGNPCDDGDSTTLFDTVSEECTCVGIPSSPGQVCENPLPINSLPFLTNDNTSSYLDVYSGAPGTFTNCGTSSSYLNGEDVVYSFTPAQATTVTITMTPSATSTGVFVYGDCADIGTDCIAGDASFTNGPKVIEELPLNGGETIYIVISGSTVSNMDYTLEIVELVTCPPGSETEGLVIGSDCEIDGFFDAVVTADCECVGTPYDCPLINANFGDPCGTYGTTQADCSCLEVTYCPSAFSNTDDEFISEVDFAGIQNPSGSTTYTNYDITFALTAGETSPITVSVTNNGSGNYTETVRVWIDFNQDGIYDPLTEQFDIGSQIVASGSTVDYTADIAVPADALSGVTGMRVSLRFSSYAEPCDNATFGEVENYMVNISSSQAANLNGTVNWNAACGDRTTTVTFYDPGTDNLIATYNTTLGADGAFSIADVAEGTFDVFVKVDGHLQKGFGNVIISSGINNLAVGDITTGDINNVDGVNIDDLTILLSAFGSTTGDPNFNPLADLNCDGDVNIDDLTLLLPNFGQSGDNAPLQ